MGGNSNQPKSSTRLILVTIWWSLIASNPRINSSLKSHNLWTWSARLTKSIR
jgi:hypothetical protein